MNEQDGDAKQEKVSAANHTGSPRADPVSTQVPRLVLALRSPAMCGSATFAIEVSKPSMNAAKATFAPISHGFDCGFYCVLSPPSAFILFLQIASFN
jgi:hypothetical protein